MANISCQRLWMSNSVSPRNQASNVSCARYSVVHTHTLHFRGARARRTHSMRFYTCMHLCRYVHYGYRWVTELTMFFYIFVNLDIASVWVFKFETVFWDRISSVHRTLNIHPLSKTNPKKSAKKSVVSCVRNRESEIGSR